MIDTENGKRKAESVLVGLLRVAAPLLLAVGCEGTGEQGRVEVGQPMPAYAAVSLEGDSVSLGAMRDTVVLLNVWATWCHPCRDEIPELVALRKKYQGKPFEIVGVSIDAAGAEPLIGAFMQEFRMDYPIWLDPEDRVSTQYLLIGVPTTFLLDKRGVLRWRHTGPVVVSDTTLVAAIERALAE